MLVSALPGIVGCQRAKEDAAWWERESERVRLVAQLELAAYRHARAAATGAAEAELVREQAARPARENALRSARSAKADLALQVVAKEKELAEFRVVAVERQRQRLLGLTYPELTVATGRIYQDVAVAAIDDAGVLIRHRDGSARLTYGVLTDEQRAQFAMCGEAAGVAEKREREMAAAYERALDRQLAALEVGQRRKALDWAERERLESEARRSSAVALASANRAATTARAGGALSQPARAFGSGSSYRYRSYRNSLCRDRDRYRTYHVYHRQVSPAASLCRLGFVPGPVLTTPTVRSAAPCLPDFPIFP